MPPPAPQAAAVGRVESGKEVAAAVATVLHFAGGSCWLCLSHLACKLVANNSSEMQTSLLRCLLTNGSIPGARQPLLPPTSTMPGWCLRSACMDHQHAVRMHACMLRVNISIQVVEDSTKALLLCWPVVATIAVSSQIPPPLCGSPVDLRPEPVRCIQESSCCQLWLCCQASCGTQQQTGCTQQVSPGHLLLPAALTVPLRLLVCRAASNSFQCYQGAAMLSGCRRSAECLRAAVSVDHFCTEMVLQRSMQGGDRNNQLSNTRRVRTNGGLWGLVCARVTISHTVLPNCFASHIQRPNVWFGCC